MLIGFKVWPREVEDVIYLHPSVREVAVVGVPDPYRGETVKAFVALKPGYEPSDELARDIQNHIRDEMPAWRTRYPGVENLNVAVMGCIVNGPGESKHADIGISLPGTGESPAAPVFIDGEKVATKAPKVAFSSFRVCKRTKDPMSFGVKSLHWFECIAI